jgi:protein O-mannosyl-transferase
MLYGHHARRAVFTIVLGLLAILLGYWQVVQVPFYLDDYSSILANPTIQPPFDFQQLLAGYASRLITYLSFALQYHIFSDNPAGYHIVSLLLHLSVSVFIGCLFFNLARTSPIKLWGAVFAATLFGIASQNTQAVIYIAQQGVLLATLFYLLSLLCFIKLRQSEKSSFPRKILFTGLLCAFSLCAFFSKQTAYTLPLAILLIEWLWFGCWLKRLGLLYLVAIFFACLGGWVISDYQWSAFLSNIDGASRETPDISRLNYLQTQVGVTWQYIAQFYYPVSLQLEYNFVLENSWNVKNIAYMFFHLGMVVIALVLGRKSPLISFGILFYYLGHGIESSIIPIRDLVFEHRTYLPNVGMVLLLAGLILQIQSKLNGRLQWPVWTCMAGIILFNLSITYSRTGQWQDKLSFYEQEIEGAQKNPRAFAAFGNALADANQCPKALGYFDHAKALYERQHKSNIGFQPEILQSYIRCLRQLGIHQKAAFLEQYLIDNVTHTVKRAGILVQRATVLMKQRQYNKANKLLEEAIRLDDKSYPAVMNLAITKVNLGELQNANVLLDRALVLRPEDELATELKEKLDQLRKQKQ